MTASNPGAIIQPDLVDITTRASLDEKSKLQRHFGRTDIFFFLICTLVGLDTIGAVAAEGAEGFTWLILLGLLFFIPYALLTAELGSAFTEEGGSYIWTRMAFGRGVAAVNAVIYWISNPIWVGGSLAILALTAFKSFFSNGEALPGPVIGVASLGDWLFLLGFIWFTVVAAIVSFDLGKWIPTIGAFVRIFVLGLFTVSVVLYGMQNGINGFAFGDFTPTYGAFVVLVPFLFFNYVGFELPSAAGEEMEDAKRDVPFGVLRAAIVTIVLYGGPILAILLILPTDQITELGGFVDAIKTVFTVYGGSVGPDGPTLEGLGLILGGLAALSLVIALVTSGTTWIMGADRAMAMAALDGAAPRSLGTLSQRFGTPINVNLLSGIVSTTVLVLALSITSGDAGKYFAASLGLAISTTTISYLAIFPALWKLRISHPHVPRPYKVPGGMAGVIVISVVTFAWALFAAAGLLFPGLGTPDPDAGLIEDGFTRIEYTLTQFVPLVLFILLGVVFYFLGRKTREEMVAIPLADEVAHDMSHVAPAPPED